MENPCAGVFLFRVRRLVIILFFLIVYSLNFGSGQYKLCEEIIPLEVIQEEDSPALYSQPGIYFLVLPGILFFTIVILSKKAREKKILTAMVFSSIFLLLFSLGVSEKKNDNYVENDSENQCNLIKAIQNYSNKQYLKASEEFLACQKNYPFSKSLRFNTALSNYKSKKLGKAVGYLHQVLKMDPMYSQAYKLLEAWEEEHEFFAMKKIIPFIDGNLIFILLICIVNIIFIFAGIKCLKPQGIWIILLISSIAIFLICGIIFGIVLNQSYCDLAVLIAPQGDLKRIPIKDASSWVTLREGTVFRILGQEADLVLVETDLELKGWIEKDLLERF